MKRLKKVLLVLFSLVAVLILATWLTFQLPTFGGRFPDGQRYDNDPPQNTDNSLLANYRLYQGGQVREPQGVIPVLKPELSEAPGLRAYWFGHASVLVEIGGLKIMTDPVLSERVSPFQWVGPKRFHPSPISLEDMPAIDAVVISHDHYDHLDMDTVRALGAKGTHFYVGKGIGSHLRRWEIPEAQIHEMAWWDILDLKGLKIHCTPARHYSGRRSMDNSTLWSSWFVEGQGHSFYFSGDTGYSPHFVDIRKRLGSPELALLKIGAYGQTWLDIHMDPESAVRAYEDLGAKTMLPVHWATFNLSYHSWVEPILRTLDAAARAGARGLITPRIGERFEQGKPFKNTDWFRQLGGVSESSPPKGQ